MARISLGQADDARNCFIAQLNTLVLWRSSSTHFAWLQLYIRWWSGFRFNWLASSPTSRSSTTPAASTKLLPLEVGAKRIEREKIRRRDRTENTPTATLLPLVAVQLNGGATGRTRIYIYRTSSSSSLCFLHFLIVVPFLLFLQRQGPPLPFGCRPFVGDLPQTVRQETITQTLLSFTRNHHHRVQAIQHSVQSRYFAYGFVYTLIFISRIRFTSVLNCS